MKYNLPPQTRALWRLLRLAAVSLALAATGWTMTIVPPTFSDLVSKSEYVVRAVVTSITSEWVGEQAQRHIVTRVRLEVKEVVLGTPPDPLILEMLGGRVGDEEMVVQGVAGFQIGEEDILFVRGNGRQFYPLTAASHGRYHVLREKNGRASIARSNHAPLHSTDEIATPLSEHDLGGDQVGTMRSGALTPEQFVQLIRSAKAKAVPARP